MSKPRTRPSPTSWPPTKRSATWIANRFARPPDAWCALRRHAILVPYRRGTKWACRQCAIDGVAYFKRRSRRQRPAAIVRATLRLPPGVPLRWVPQYALFALVRAYSRQRGEPLYRPARRHEYRHAALGFFPDHQWVRYGHTPQLCVPCPSCGALARALVAGSHGWTCRSCRPQRKEQVLARSLGNWVCAARFGLPTAPLRHIHAVAVRAVARCPGDLVLLVGARSTLLLDRPQDLRQLFARNHFAQRRLGGARPPWGEIHLRLSPRYPDALWDQLLSPAAYYERFAFRSHSVLGS